MAKTSKKTTAKAKQVDAPAKKKKKAAAKKATVKKKTTTKKAAVKKKATAKKAVVKKATTKKAAPKKKATAKKAAAKQPTAKKGAVRTISADERRQMVAESAYLRGESQGFLSDEREDWVQAEAEVDALLAKANIVVSD